MAANVLFNSVDRLIFVKILFIVRQLHESLRHLEKIFHRFIPAGKIIDSCELIGSDIKRNLFIPAVSVDVPQIYHGNIVQGVYAFFLGMIMALCCWRFETLWAPIVIHVVANITSVCITEIPVIGNMFEQTSVLIVATIVTTILWTGISAFLLKKKFKDKLV